MDDQWIRGVGLTADTSDVSANQAGQLSESQRDMLLKRQRSLVLAGVAAAVIIIGVTLLFARFAGITDRGNLLLMVALFGLPPLMLTALEFMRYRADIIGNQAVAASGELTLPQRGLMIVDDVSLHIEKGEAETLKPYVAQHCRVYYTPRTRIILALIQKH